MAIASVNPATGKTIREFQPLTNAELEHRLSLAASAFVRYRRTSFEQRAAAMRKAANILDRDRRRFAETITIEMGKPVKASEAEVAKCATVCRYYADHAADHLKDEPVQTGAAESYVRYLPIGPILAIMPWNFPFWQVFRFAAPTLMAGNVGLLKHASNVPQCALAIEEIFREAGFEEGVFQALLVEATRVEMLLRDPRVAAATLTGSEAAGASVGSIAGEEIKKVVLELGGSDPFIIMPSADLEEAVKTAVKARTINAGQSCIAAKRFIVHQSIADEFETRFVAAMNALKVGDPMNEENDLGPLSSAGIAEDLQKQVDETVAKGGRLLTGGHRIGDRGIYYAPTVLAAVPDDSPGARDELFGPVASVFRVRSIDEAIERANDTPFGLGASAWTRDSAETSRFIDEIEAG
ncbi:MAG TPA: NAD-dependent succinate-semialdehyde dehydrogenase, partial [Thermoanaerobaculia bacterium]|nr:NAD-dependent succinate-semialdehyde dehydrogenase [Thermoanaerobaculia bacterium]